MIQGSRKNLFLFRFPQGFVPEDIEKKYIEYLKARPIPFQSIIDYLNYSIQSTTFPGYEIDNTRQEHKAQNIFHKSGWDLQKSQEGEVVITFKNSESHLIYFILLEFLWNFHAYNNTTGYLPPMYLHIIDWDGNVFITYEMSQVLFKEISALELSYASNIPEFSSFTCTFKYNLIKIIVPKRPMLK